MLERGMDGFPEEEHKCSGPGKFQHIPEEELQPARMEAIQPAGRDDLDQLLDPVLTGWDNTGWIRQSDHRPPPRW